MADADTPSKRASALQFWRPWWVAMPLADGALEQGDRQHIARSYSGILAAGAVIPPPVTPTDTGPSGPGVSGGGGMGGSHGWDRSGAIYSRREPRSKRKRPEEEVAPPAVEEITAPKTPEPVPPPPAVFEPVSLVPPPPTPKLRGQDTLRVDIPAPSVPRRSITTLTAPVEEPKPEPTPEPLPEPTPEEAQASEIQARLDRMEQSIHDLRTVVLDQVQTIRDLRTVVVSLGRQGAKA